MDKAELFWIAGQLHAKLPLLRPSTREAVDLALVGAVWKAFVRDAGPGETGSMFAGWQNGDHVLLTSDPRAGAVLAWLSSRDGPLRKPAERLHAARGSSGISFSADEKEMLVKAGAILADAHVKFDGEPPIDAVLRAIQLFRDDWQFASGPPGHGEYVGGVWAANLMLATFKSDAPQIGILSRQSLRHDQTVDTALMRECWAQQLKSISGVVADVAKGCSAVVSATRGHSANSRVPEVGGALAAMNSMRRGHIQRGWHLSEAGTTLVMRHLVELGIAESAGRGLLAWASNADREPAHYDEWMKQQDALVELEEAMQNADRVLGKSE